MARQYREIARSNFSEEEEEEEEEKDDRNMMPGEISLEILEPPVQYFSSSFSSSTSLYGSSSMVGSMFETPKVKLVWPISSVSECLGESWSGMYDILQDVFRDEFGTRLIKTDYNNASVDLVFEMPSLRTMARLGIPDIFEDPRKFATEFARVFIGLIAKRKIMETLTGEKSNSHKKLEL